ncbi:MAG: hypothetical protein E7642_03365 [Ruminococcaceae bacterium]|nr:hypothetical protein [Oscillospiraceae bacterium]
MAKKLFWEYSEPETDIETGELTGNTLTHTISLSYSYFSGKAVVTIDGSEFNISERPFALKGTEQMFRLGDSAALLRFESGEPTVTVDNEILKPIKK